MSDELGLAKQQGYEDAKRAYESGAARAREEVSEHREPAIVQVPANEDAPENLQRQRSYQATAETARILQELRAVFGLATDSAVIRRALALARVIARAAQGADSIRIRKNDGTEQEIILRG